jgi:tetratricopeptide (TPR) repeat protein
MNPEERPPGEPGFALGEDMDTGALPDRWLYKWVVAGVLLAVAGAAFALPAYRYFKARRAEGIARMVAARLDTGSATNVLTDVRLMLDLAPTNDLVLRTAARYCSSNRLPEAVNYWRLYLNTVPGSHDDHLALATAAMDAGQYDVATTELARLIVRPGGDPEATRLALRLCMKRGAWRMAARAAEEVLRLDPDDEQAELWHGVALIRTRVPSWVAQARGEMSGMAFRSKTHWKDAIDVLLEAPEVTRAELRLIQRRLQSSPPEGPDDVMRVLSVEWLLDDGQRDRTIDKALALVTDPGATEGSVRTAGRWLLARGAAERLLAALPLERSRGDRTRIQLHVLALAHLGRWGPVMQIVDQPEYGLEAHVGVVMSIVASWLGADGSNQIRAKAVLANQDLTLHQLLEAAQLAEEFGLYEAAIDLMEPLLANPATMPEAANHILALANNTDRLALRRTALDRLLKAFPTDTVALQQLGYLEAVVPGGDLGVVRILERKPGGATNQFTQLVCALADIRNGKADAALARLAAAAPGGGSLDYRLHMAYAAAYGIVGDQHEARRHAALAEQARMQHEELDLIRRWLPAKPK